MTDFDLPELPPLKSVEQMTEEVRTANEQSSLEQLKFAEHFHYAFNTPTGKKVLEFLITNTLELSTLEKNNLINASIPDAKDYMLIREGQNQIVRFIVRKIKEYEERNKK